MDDLNLGKEGTRLLKLYQKTLGITLEETIIIIMKNKTAQALLKEELALSVTGIYKNLSILLSYTLLRDFYDFEPIRENEKKLVKKYYGIEIGNKQYSIENKKNNNLNKAIYNRIKINKKNEKLIIAYVDKAIVYRHSKPNIAPHNGRTAIGIKTNPLFAKNRSHLNRLIARRNRQNNDDNKYSLIIK